MRMRGIWKWYDGNKVDAGHLCLGFKSALSCLYVLIWGV